MEKDDDVNRGCIFSVMFLVFVTLYFAGCWYFAGVQSAVYRRQGVEMSTWEVFCGAKPAERTINFKE